MTIIAGSVSGVDVDAIKARTDLLALIGADTALKRVATTRGGEYGGPCPFCGGTDRLRVQPERGLWWCRACGGEHWQDAIAYVMRRDGVTFGEALRVLGGNPSPRPNKQVPTGLTGLTGGIGGSTGAAIPTPTTPPATPSAIWQARARDYCDEAARTLWSPAGARALAYLRECRGLTDETIRRFGLGYQPQDAWQDPQRWGLEGKRTYLARGIVIPGLADGTPWYVKTRRPRPGDELAQHLGGEASSDGGKFTQVRGGVPRLFWAAPIVGGTLALTEGELDAMILAQAAGDLVGVATLASASAGLDPRDTLALLPARAILACYDSDEAGQRGAAKVSGLSGRIRRVSVPRGKDLTDYWRAGGDLRALVGFWLLVAPSGSPNAAPSAAVDEAPSGLPSADAQDEAPQTAGGIPLGVRRLAFDIADVQAWLDSHPGHTKADALAALAADRQYLAGDELVDEGPPATATPSPQAPTATPDVDALIDRLMAQGTVLLPDYAESGAPTLRVLWAEGTRTPDVDELVRKHAWAIREALPPADTSTGETTE